MEHRKNANYGETRCFHCLLNPHWQESAIFIGINKLIAKSVEEGSSRSSSHPSIYPCKIVNRFECPYNYEKEKESSVNTKFEVEDLFELEKMVYAVEIALAVARKDTSKIQLKNKQDLYHALTDRETLYKILEQASDYVLHDKNTFEQTSKQNLCEQYQKNKDKIVDYFMNIKENLKLEELRFY